MTTELIKGEYSHSDKYKRKYYYYTCFCKNVFTAAPTRVKSGNVRSCGCLRCDAHKKHGKKYDRVYKIWSGIKSRCLNENSKDFNKYSKLGMCDEWKEFVNFYKDMGDPPADDHQIDRIDNNKGYFKSNCRWVTISGNSRNRISSKLWYVNGEKFNTVYEVADEFNVSPAAAARWFNGYTSRGKKYPPKEGFRSEYVYKQRG